MSEDMEKIRLIGSEGRYHAEAIKLPKGFFVEHKVNSLGYTIHFGGFYGYIPYEASKMYVEEIIKDVLLNSGMKSKEIIKFLTG